MGIRAVVVPLIEENSFEGDPVVLYEALESWKQWIEENGKHLIDFNGAAVLNDAAGSGRLAVALGVEGAGLFQERILHFKNLAKLGLDVVSLGDPSGPLFVEGKWSAFGRTFFDVCRKENVLIDWTITDTACIRAMK